MKIWQLLSPKNLTHADRDLPAPQEGYAKVKITRALLSEADVAVYSGATRVKYPVVPGRYAVGQVVEAGENRDGFYRDFAFVNASEAYTLPPSVSDEAAFLIDAVATAEKIVDETGVGAGQHVLVIGGGLYANILCQILIYHRAVPVLADNNAERLALAKKCGIYYTFPYDDICCVLRAARWRMRRCISLFQIKASLRGYFLLWHAAQRRSSARERRKT